MIPAHLQDFLEETIDNQYSDAKIVPKHRRDAPLTDYSNALSWLDDVTTFETAPEKDAPQPTTTTVGALTSGDLFYTATDELADTGTKSPNWKCFLGKKPTDDGNIAVAYGNPETGQFDGQLIIGPDERITTLTDPTERTENTSSHSSVNAASR